MFQPSIHELKILKDLDELINSDQLNPNVHEKDQNIDELRKLYYLAIVQLLQKNGISTEGIDKEFDKVWSIILSVRRLREKNEIIKPSPIKIILEKWELYKDKTRPYILGRVIYFDLAERMEESLQFLERLKKQNV